MVSRKIPQKLKHRTKFYTEKHTNYSYVYWFVFLSLLVPIGAIIIYFIQGGFFSGLDTFGLCMQLASLLGPLIVIASVYIMPSEWLILDSYRNKVEFVKKFGPFVTERYTNIYDVDLVVVKQEVENGREINVASTALGLASEAIVGFGWISREILTKTVPAFGISLRTGPRKREVVLINWDRRSTEKIVEDVKKLLNKQRNY